VQWLGTKKCIHFANSRVQFAFGRLPSCGILKKPLNSFSPKCFSPKSCLVPDHRSRSKAHIAALNHAASAPQSSHSTTAHAAQSSRTMTSGLRFFLCPRAAPSSLCSRLIRTRDSFETASCLIGTCSLSLSYRWSAPLRLKIPVVLPHNA